MTKKYFAGLTSLFYFVGEASWGMKYSLSTLSEAFLLVTRIPFLHLSLQNYSRHSSLSYSNQNHTLSLVNITQCFVVISVPEVLNYSIIIII